MKIISNYKRLVGQIQLNLNLRDKTGLSLEGVFQLRREHYMLHACVRIKTHNVKER